MNHMSSTLDKYKWSMTARFTIKEGKYQSLKPIRNFKNQNPVGWKAYTHVSKCVRLQDLDYITARNGMVNGHFKNGWTFTIVWNTPTFRSNVFYHVGAVHDDGYQHEIFGEILAKEIGQKLQIIMDK